MTHYKLMQNFKDIKKFNISSNTPLLVEMKLIKYKHKHLPDFVKKFVTEEALENTFFDLKNMFLPSFFDIDTIFSKRLLFHTLPFFLKKNKFKDIIDNFQFFNKELESIQSDWSIHLINVHFFGFFNYIINEESIHSDFFLQQLNMDKKSFIIKYTKDYLIYLENNDQKITDKVVKYLDYYLAKYTPDLINERKEQLIISFLSVIDNYNKEHNILTPESFWIDRYITFVSKKYSNSSFKQFVINI